MKKFKSKMIKDTDAFQIKAKSVKEITDENGAVSIEVEWYASTKNKDRGNDIVEPEAFKSAMETYMTNPIVLLQHDMDKPIWIVTDAVIDDKWLFIKAKISEDEDWVFSKLKNGVLRCFSIWYRIKDFEDRDVYDSEWAYIWGECVIKDLELYEISIVSVPMNPYALVKSMSNCFEQEEVDEWDATEEVAENVETEQPENNDVENVETENTENVETEEKEIVDENVNVTEEEKVDEPTEEPVTDENETVEETKEVDESETEWDSTEECTTSVEEMDEMIDENKNETNEQTEEEVKEENVETNETTEEVVEETTDEQPEIDEQDTNEKDDSSENVVETTTDEKVDKNVNLKEMSRKSIKAFIESETKSNNEKLLNDVKSLISQKDEEIANLKWELKATQDALLKCAEYISDIDTVLTNTVQKKWIAFYKAEKKNESMYADVVKLVKNI